jgi:hypothetical protein
MKMKKIILLLLASLLFTGSVVQTYEQKMYETGDSLITEHLDLSLFSQVMPNNSIPKMASACLSDLKLNCEVDVDSKSITIIRSFSANNNHYTFQAEQSIIDTLYTLTVIKIPNDRFKDSLNEVMVEAGVSETKGPAEVAINLNDKEGAAETAASMEKLDLEILYEIEMPGEVVSAKAGDIRAEIDDSAVRFDMVEVLKDSEPLVIKSRKLNLIYVAGVFAVLILILISVSFFIKKKPKEEPKKKRKKRRNL